MSFLQRAVEASWGRVPEELRFRARRQPLFYRVRRLYLRQGRRRKTVVTRRNSTLGPCTHTTAARPVLVCLANIDWDARRQRPQELLAALVDRGWSVYYVTPHDDPTLAVGQLTLSALAEHVVGVEFGGEPADAYAHPKTARAQAAAVEALAALRREAAIDRAVVLVQFPTWAYVALEARDRFGWNVFYDCMDDWSDFPDVGVAQGAAETVLLRNADRVICTSQTLRDVICGRLPLTNVALVPNGFDPAKLDRARSRHRSERVAGFMGALAPWLDYGLLEDLINRMPDWSFEFVGDQFDARARMLGRHRNVTLHGLLPHEEALAVAANFTVGLIPFEDSATTATVDPVKMYEYLGLGVPTVARDLPQMRTYTEHVSLANSAAEFEACIRSLADSAVPQATRDWLANQSWQARAAAVDPLLRSGFPRVSVVITSFGQGNLTVACVDSILRHSPGFELQLIVVDNGSDPTTVTTLEHGLDSPSVELILLPDNRGFAAACNVGYEACTGDVVVMLNNDTLVTIGWLTPLLEQLERRDVGLVGPVSNSVGNQAWRPLPGLSAANYCERGWAYMASAAEAPFDIPMLGFFCVAGRREVWKEAGPLSEEFGIGMFEDDDYAQRIRRGGRRLICTPRSYVFHYGQASFSQLDQQVYEALWQRNQDLYESRWGTWVPHAKRE